MAESTRRIRTVRSALATFHTVTFFLVLVLIAFVAGALGSALGSLNTLVGVFVFIVFWLTTWWASARTLKGVGESIVRGQPLPVGAGRLFLRGGLYGGINGILFLFVGSLVFAAVLAAQSTAPIGPAQLIEFGFFLLSVIGFGSALAFIIGAIVGLIFVAIDFVSLAVSHLAFSVISGSSAVRAD